MKKRAVGLLALMLALAMLAGCALPGFEKPAGEPEVDLSVPLGETLSQIAGRADHRHNPDGVMFADMRYSRPDTDRIGAYVEAVESALDSGASLEEVEAALELCLAEYDSFFTMNALANIYNCRDLRDEYWAAEYEWISTESAEVSRKYDRLYYACAGSPYGARLEEDYFWDGFCEEYDDPADSYYTDETVALMQRESELVSRYRGIVAQPTVLYDGEERDFNELFEQLSEATDMASYYRYLAVLKSYYEKYSAPLGEVYIELMRVRSDMAEAMGFDSCEAMEYGFCFERDYTPQDGARFVEQVKEHLVPIYVWARESGALDGSDYSALSPQELRAGLAATAASIGRDCAETFFFMDRYRLYDIEPSLYKADTSFEVYLNSYHSPFIFLNPVGTTEDLITFMHELGHATDAYVNDDAYETLDLAEVFSQAMEFLSLSHMDGVLSAREIDTLREGAVIGALNSFIQQSLLADFEHKAYSLGADALSPDKLNELFLQSAKDFGFCEEGFEEYYMYYWMDIPHFFEFPFYVISYPVSLEVAMEIYELELSRPGLGESKYFEILPRDYDGFLETLDHGGLRDPFAEDSMVSVAAMIADALGYEGPLAEAA